MVFLLSVISGACFTVSLATSLLVIEVIIGDLHVAKRSLFLTRVFLLALNVDFCFCSAFLFYL